MKNNMTPEIFKQEWDKAVNERNFKVLAVLLPSRKDNLSLFESLLKNLVLKVERENLKANLFRTD